MRHACHAISNACVITTLDINYINCELYVRNKLKE